MPGFERVTTMQRKLDASGSQRLWLGLIGVSTLALMAGCGMFDSSTPAQSAKVRPGADRAAAATG
ncbi:MAG: hypothetical protein Q8L19_20595, partial [Reyranella sp.]|nr:hypothetical protein [Reyranella sp.]